MSPAGHFAVGFASKRLAPFAGGQIAAVAP